MKKCVVIYNPNSGKKIKKVFLANFVEILLKHDYTPEIIFSKYKGHITQIVSDLNNDIDLVISVGGDGTFNEAMSGNFQRKNRLLLAHIPVGTTNDIGAMFGYGNNIIRNFMLLLDGEEHNVDICTINGRPFVYVAGFGKFMNVPYETSRNLKKKYGHAAYIMQGAKELLTRTKLYDIEYVVDGETYSGLYSFLSISNATRMAGIKDFVKDVKLDDNQFEVLLCNLTRKKDIVKSLYYLTKNDITKVPGFYFHKVSSMKIKFLEEDKKNWCIDGEKLDDQSNEFDISIVNNVRLLIPKRNVDKLFVKK